MNTARSFGPAVVTGFPFGTQWIVRLLSLNQALFYELIQALAHSIGWGLVLARCLQQGSTPYSSSKHTSSFFPPTPINAHSRSHVATAIGNSIPMQTSQTYSFLLPTQSPKSPLDAPCQRAPRREEVLASTRDLQEPASAAHFQTVVLDIQQQTVVVCTEEM